MPISSAHNHNIIVNTCRFEVNVATLGSKVQPLLFTGIENLGSMTNPNVEVFPQYYY